MQLKIQQGLQFLGNLSLFEKPSKKYLVTRRYLIFYNLFFLCLDQSVIEVHEEKLQPRSKFSCGDYTSAVDSFSSLSFSIPMHTFTVSGVLQRLSALTQLVMLRGGYGDFFALLINSYS